MSYVKLSKDSDKLLSSNGILLSAENILLDPFAFYSEDDNSLTFCRDKTIPKVGDKCKKKTVTTVYTDFLDQAFDNYDNLPPWKTSDVKYVIFDESFANVQPDDLCCWFYNISSCESFDLRYLDTSKVTKMNYTFYNCNKVQTIDITTFDTSNVTEASGIFQSCKSLVSIDISKFDTSKIAKANNMFYGCSNLNTIFSDDSVFNLENANTSLTMFGGCESLVGGNGTTFDSSKVNASMAHVDTPDNPGYFTAKGD